MSRALGDYFLKETKMGVSAQPHVSEPIQLSHTGGILIVASDGVS